MPVIALALATKSLSYDVVSSLKLAKVSRLNSVINHRTFRRSFRFGPPSTQFSLPSQPQRQSDPTSWDVLRNIRNISANYPYLVFYSTSHDPYQNLAIENYLLRNSDHSSRILFFYANRPCIVFGRNQNPWLECNIARIQAGLPWQGADWSLPLGEDGKNVPLQLIRRRSGGGTVVHDVGNLNFSFIVPNDKEFTRAKHADVVVRALMKPPVFESQNSQEWSDSEPSRLYEQVRVNERNDIVIRKRSPRLGEENKDFKVTGSAYKLTRGRAMHHGTLLHSSPNVHTSASPSSPHSLSTFLSSPGKAFIDAKGVGSVSSPVSNLFLLPRNSSVNIPPLRNSLRSMLVSAIAREFWTMYTPPYDILEFEVGEQDCREDVNPDIAKDVHELMTDEWRFDQTPQFVFHSMPDSDGQTGAATEIEWPGLSFRVKMGIIQEPKWDGKPDSALAALEGKKLYSLSNWAELLSDVPNNQREQLVARLESVFPAIHLANVTKASSATNVRSEAVDTQIADGTVLDQDQGNATVERVARSGSVKEIEKKGQNLVEER